MELIGTINFKCKCNSIALLQFVNKITLEKLKQYSKKNCIPDQGHLLKLLELLPHVQFPAKFLTHSHNKHFPCLLHRNMDFNIGNCKTILSAAKPIRCFFFCNNSIVFVNFFLLLNSSPLNTTYSGEYEFYSYTFLVVINIRINI